jgi:DNA-binding LacI/PurR family transcriptional regulator
LGWVIGASGWCLGRQWKWGRTASLEAAGLPVAPELIVDCGPTIEDGYQATLRLLALPDRPTAILAINDLLAIGVLRAGADLGLHAPADLSVVGFDDIDAARCLAPRLTTAARDAVRLGREAVQLALQRLQNPDLPRQVVYVPTQFVVRESTGPAPGVVQSSSNS